MKKPQHPVLSRNQTRLNLQTRFRGKSANEPTKYTICVEERTVTILMTGLQQNRRYSEFRRTSVRGRRA
jgi:hypothetical protein